MIYHGLLSVRGLASEKPLLDLFVEYQALSLVSYGMMITDFYYGYMLGYTVNQSAAMYSYLRPVDINEQS